MDPDNRNVHVVSEIMQGRVRRIMEKVAMAPKPHPGTIRLDASCYAPPRARRRESAMSAVPGDLGMSSMAQSPEHSSMDHSMGSFLNHGRDTLLPDDFDAASRRSTTAAAGAAKAKAKRKSPQPDAKAVATRKAAKTKPKQLASPVRRSTRAARAARPNYAEDDEDADVEDEAPFAASGPPAGASNADDDQENNDQENDESQARQNVAKTAAVHKRTPAAGGGAKAAKPAKPAKAAEPQTFRSRRSRRR